MKKILFLAATALLMACSNDSDSVFNGSAVETEVTLTFSPYDMEPMTRAAVSEFATHLDVWLYESGNESAAVHQSSGDAGFGSVSVTLNKTKTYTLYAVAHRCADDATLADGVISFPDDKVTHSFYYTTTFTPSEVSNLACAMQRIVAQFRLEITDDIPDDVAKMQFTIANVFDRWNIGSGGTHQLDRTSSINYNGTSSIFNVYAIVTDVSTTQDITVVALNENDQPVQSRLFSAVPLRNGYKTTYQGTFFVDSPLSMTFTASDWNSYDPVEF